MNNFLDMISSVMDGVASEELRLFLLCLSCLVGFSGMLLLYFKNGYHTNKKIKDLEQLVSGVRGKLEKHEQEIHRMNTNVLRGKEINTGKLDEIKTVVDSLKKKRPKQSEKLKKSTSGSEIAAQATVALGSEALSDKLSKTRQGIFGKIKGLFADRNDFSVEDIEDIEELLITADLGVVTSTKLIDSAKDYFKTSGGVTQDALLGHIRDQLKEQLTFNQQLEYPIDPTSSKEKPKVILVIGVNGVGKTTSVAKLASRWQADKHNVIMAAADTFRAAAVDQLKEWGQRLDVPVVTGAENAKPATVVYDAIDRAVSDSADVLLVDTAGRLHNKANLMQELEGIKNVIQKKLGREPDETILVVDGATGQNALTQAKEFNAIAPLTGIIVTKLDGTAKGGIVVAIKSELDIPIRYIGVGEAAEDLRLFNSQEFAEAIVG